MSTAPDLVPPQSAAEPTPAEHTDIWRNSLVRYLGYANELGESFRPIAPQLVRPSYIVAFAYVLGDTSHKSSVANEHATLHQLSPVKRNAVVAAAAIDTLLWQTLASIAIPGLTINRVVALSKNVVERTATNSPVLRRWAPTAIGLGVIPLIIHPIDAFVDQAMDVTTRKWSARLLDSYDK